MPKKNPDSLFSRHKNMGDRCSNCKTKINPRGNRKGLCFSCSAKEGYKNGRVNVNKGKKLEYLHTSEVRKRSTESRKGYKHTEETRKKMSEIHKKRVIEGKNHLWKGGITPINKTIRESFEYKLWREAVFERDDYTCVWCKQRGGTLNADHIKPFAYYPELRFAIDNGRTLCRECHKTTNTYGRSK